MTKLWLNADTLVWDGTNPTDCADCPCGTPPDCTYCNSGTAPVRWHVTISGFVFGSGSCPDHAGDLAKINTTITCDNFFTFGSPVQCGWDNGNPQDICSGQRRDVEVLLAATAIQINVYTGGGISTFQVAWPSGPPMDCSTISGLNVPYFGDTGAPLYTGSGATVSLTAA